MSSTTTYIIRGIRSSRRGQRVLLDLGLDDPVELAAAVCPAFAVGDRLDRGELERLRGDSDAYQAREAALHLLSYRARSAAELADRLRRKGFDSALVDSTLDGLRRSGILDDAAFAEGHVRDAVRGRPRGRRRMLSELRRKGVAETTASAAVTRVLAEEGSDESALAARAAEAWARRAVARDRACLCGHGERADVDRVRRRFWGYMARRGFGPDAVRAAIEGVCA